MSTRAELTPIAIGAEVGSLLVLRPIGAKDYPTNAG